MDDLVIGVLIIHEYLIVNATNNESLIQEETDRGRRIEYRPNK